MRRRRTGSHVVKRGEIYFVNLSPTQGREQAGYRPVLVVSADAINRQPLVVAVVVGASAKQVPRDYPTNVRVSARESGLPRGGVMFVHNPVGTPEAKGMRGTKMSGE